MKRKLLIILFFIVVFGLPVLWYITLQVFGENKFDLPILDQLESECVDSNHAYLVIDSLSMSEHRNEYLRLNKRFQTIKQEDLMWVYHSKCKWSYPVILVDEIGQVRGNYEISREEMDRLLTEIDIYLLNLNSSSN